MSDWKQIAEVQGQVHQLAHRFEALADLDWRDVSTRDKLLAAASILDVAANRCQEAIVTLRISQPAEDDPIGCPPNAAVDAMDIYGLADKLRTTPSHVAYAHREGLPIHDKEIVCDGEAWLAVATETINPRPSEAPCEGANTDE